MLLKKLKIKLLQKQKKVENKVVTEAKKVGNKIATEAKAIGNDLKALVDMNYEDNICDSLCVEDTTEKQKKINALGAILSLWIVYGPQNYIYEFLPTSQYGFPSEEKWQSDLLFYDEKKYYCICYGIISCY